MDDPIHIKPSVLSITQRSLVASPLNQGICTSFMRTQNRCWQGPIEQDERCDLGVLQEKHPHCSIEPWLIR